MPERMATIEANFNALVARLDRQVEADAKVHRDLTTVVQRLELSDRKRESQQQRLIGGLAVLIALANLIGPVVARLYVP